VGGDREVCLFEEETYAALRAEGSNVNAGCFGENLTISGIPFAELAPGARLRVGDEAELQITLVRAPCKNLTQFDERFPEALVGRSGWMAKVVRGGKVKTGDVVARI
jgi:MOSC domain-containing protein YiiM